MASKITFTGVVIRHVAMKLDAKSEHVVVELKMTANWTKAVREKMGWEELKEVPEAISSTKLNGKLIGVDMSLMPMDGKLAKHRFENISIRSVGGFEAKRIKVNENATAVELEFKIISLADDVEAYSGAYLRAIGEAKGNLKIEYTEQLSFGEQPEADPQQNIPSEG